MIDYTAVSMAVILRDMITPKYMNDEHQKLTDIADALYNAGLTAEYLKPEYKDLYDRYGLEFWQKVIDDAAAIDSQLDGHEQELIDDYNDMIKH